MTVAEIIRQVRLCIDEESNCTSAITDEKDDVYMDNIIRAKIPDAVRWASVNAPASSFVFGDNDNSSSMLKEYATDGEENQKMDYQQDWDAANNIGCISFPSGSPVRLVRVRGKGWHKAVMAPFEEDSDEALMMYDETAKGTADNPVAVIVRTNPTKLLVQPASESFSASFVNAPSVDTSSDEGTESYSIPEVLRSSVVYYVAFLLLSAYEDSRATQMYNIALQQMGTSQNPSS